MFGTNLASLRARTDARRTQGPTVRPGGDALRRLVSEVDAEERQVTVSGTVYQVFTLGVHNPDDPAVYVV